MCGRFTASSDHTSVLREFETQTMLGGTQRPSWNVAPTQDASVVLERKPREGSDEPAGRQLRTLRWGLIPSWAKDSKIGSRLINARMETITEKPAFRKAAVLRRCLVPADGYYEWMPLPDQPGNQPYYLRRPGSILGLAGLYELWPQPDKADDAEDRWLWTFTVLTTSASDATGHIHDRSPVVIPPEMRADWLDPVLTDADEVRELLAAVPESLLEPIPVSRRVNNVRNNGPDLIEPVEPAPTAPAQLDS